MFPPVYTPSTQRISDITPIIITIVACAIICWILGSLTISYELIMFIKGRCDDVNLSAVCYRNYNITIALFGLFVVFPTISIMITIILNTVLGWIKRIHKRIYLKKNNDESQV